MLPARLLHRVGAQEAAVRHRCKQGLEVVVGGEPQGVEGAAELVARLPQGKNQVVLPPPREGQSHQRLKKSLQTIMPIQPPAFQL